MTTPLQRPGWWVADSRGEGRGVRVSAHDEAGLVVVSTWRGGTCTSTVRLRPDEAAELVSGLAGALGALASQEALAH